MSSLTKSSVLFIAAFVLAWIAWPVESVQASETVQGGAAHSSVYHDWLGRKCTSRSVAVSDQTIYVDRNELIYVDLLASYSDSSRIQGARHELILEVYENGQRLGHPASDGGFTSGWETGSWFSQPRMQFSLGSPGWHYLDVKVQAKTDSSTKTRWGLLRVQVR